MWKLCFEIVCSLKMPDVEYNYREEKTSLLISEPLSISRKFSSTLYVLNTTQHDNGTYFCTVQANEEAVTSEIDIHVLCELVSLSNWV